MLKPLLEHLGLGLGRGSGSGLVLPARGERGGSFHESETEFRAGVRGMAKRGGVRRGEAGCGEVRRGAAWRGEEWRAGAAHLLVGRDDERGAPLLGHVVVQR
eukprot:scaffold82323_cov45-Phaeocystis_antarctica.AAC.2